MTEQKPERIAKVLARAGLCSRREAERWIEAGRVQVDGRTLDSPAFTVDKKNIIMVDGKPLAEPQETRLWRYHKPTGLVTTHKDPQGRPTVFERLPKELGRVISIGRLDLNSEGLLLLTNDGELARRMEMPATGWLRRYRVTWTKSLHRCRSSPRRSSRRREGRALRLRTRARQALRPKTRGRGGPLWVHVAAARRTRLRQRKMVAARATRTAVGRPTLRGTAAPPSRPPLRGTAAWRR